MIVQRLATILVCLLLAGALRCQVHAAPDERHDLKIFSGEPRLLIVHGYSTSAHWWAFLQRKIDRYTGGSDQRVVEVQLCNKGGTPIARWMNIETGKRSEAWRTRFTPMIQAEKGRRPVIVLAQQSLQFAFAERRDGIRDENDAKRIQKGADIIEQYGQTVLDDGAAAVFIGMHIYKVTMEPEIGNERFALSKLMQRNPKGIFAGPDVWQPTSEQHPLAFDRDRVHPNYIGAEIMAHYWFATLLEHDGLQVPAWSRREMNDAIARQPLGVTRDRAAFARLLKDWQITRRPAPQANRAQPPQANRAVSQRVLDRYDKDGDGKLNQQEQAAFDRARQTRNEQRNNRGRP